MKSVFLIFTAIFYLLLNKIDCKNKNRKVVGKSGKISDYPYLVSISYRGKHICGGTYIKSRWVLTAAHCFFQTRYTEDRPRYVCVMGRTYLNETGRQVQRRDALYEVEHVDYNEETNRNDIALMFLKRAFRTSKTVNYVAIAKKISYSYDEHCVVVGWGIEIDENDRLLLSNQLKWNTIDILMPKYCFDAFPPSYKLIFDGDKTICTTYAHSGLNSAQGESGGPLVCSSKQIGIVSWGTESARHFPGVYTNVLTFRRWIDKAMKQPRSKLNKKSGSDFFHTVADRGYQILPTLKYSYIILLIYIAV